MVAVVTFYAYQRVTENLVIDRDRELTRLSAGLLAAELAPYTDPWAEQYLDRVLTAGCSLTPTGR